MIKRIYIYIYCHFNLSNYYYKKIISQLSFYYSSTHFRYFQFFYLPKKNKILRRLNSCQFKINIEISYFTEKNIVNHKIDF